MRQPDPDFKPHEAISLIHEASLFLELSFRRASDCLRRAQCELPLNATHGERLQANEEHVKRGLVKIYDIQVLCDRLKSYYSKSNGNGNH